MQRLIRGLILVTALAGLMASGASTAAAESATFKVTVKSAFLRQWPSLQAARTLSVFQGQVYSIVGRTDDGQWIQLQIPARGTDTWIATALGEVRGDLRTVPVPAAWNTGEPPAPAAVSADGAPVQAGAILRMTITVKSTFARNAPQWTAARARSLFKSEVYTAVGRTKDAQWIQVRLGNMLGWVPVGVGKLDGNTGLLAVNEFVVPGQTNSVWEAGDSGRAPWIPIISPYMRQVYEQAPQFGHSQNVFTIVGDCNSEGPVYLKRMALGKFGLGGYEALQPAADFFAVSFVRDGVGVYGGFATASVLDPNWGHPVYCQPGEGPLACELRLSQASIVFISLGTGDQYTWQGAEANYRLMVEHALRNGALPVLVTKADALESLRGGAAPDYLNNVMRRLAQEYQIPLLDFWLATRRLPNNGLKSDLFHVTEEAADLHLLITLQTLDAIWRR